MMSAESNPCFSPGRAEDSQSDSSVHPEGEASTVVAAQEFLNEIYSSVLIAINCDGANVPHEIEDVGSSTLVQCYLDGLYSSALGTEKPREADVEAARLFLSEVYNAALAYDLPLEEVNESEPSHPESVKDDAIVKRYLQEIYSAALAKEEHSGASSSSSNISGETRDDAVVVQKYLQGVYSTALASTPQMDEVSEPCFAEQPQSQASSELKDIHKLLVEIVKELHEIRTAVFSQAKARGALIDMSHDNVRVSGGGNCIGRIDQVQSRDRERLGPTQGATRITHLSAQPVDASRRREDRKSQQPAEPDQQLAQQVGPEEHPKAAQGLQRDWKSPALPGRRLLEQYAFSYDSPSVERRGWVKLDYAAIHSGSAPANVVPSPQLQSKKGRRAPSSQGQHSYCPSPKRQSNSYLRTGREKGSSKSISSAVPPPQTKGGDRDRDSWPSAKELKALPTQKRDPATRRRSNLTSVDLRLVDSSITTGSTAKPKKVAGNGYVQKTVATLKRGDHGFSAIC